MKSDRSKIKLSSQSHFGLFSILITGVVLTLTSCGSPVSIGKSASSSPATVNLTSPSSNPNANKMGMNIAAPLDYAEDRLYADAVRTARDFKAGTDANTTTLSAVDATGWPTADFSFYVWAGLPNMHGTYSLTFTGKANVSSNPGGVVSTTYDSNTNTSSATINVTTTGNSVLTLSFTNTQRTSGSATGTGVTSIKLMRPTAPGANTSYPVTAMFTDPIKALLAKFSTIRFMDFLSTNSNQQVTWADRPLPGWPSFNRFANKNGYGWQGIGGPWEHVILLANETNMDAWINIPVNANDTYITNVANLFAYGSDGVNPYTSPQANPVYPPLNPNLKLYIEYSNELWNSGPAFTQSITNCQAASDELFATSGKSLLNWDNTWNNVTYVKGGSNTNWKWSMCNRRPAKRTVEISTLFRSVFGDTQMMTRIRPVMMTQLTFANGMLFDEANMLMNYYNNMDPAYPGSPTPHPPSYYIYAAGGSAYYKPKDSTLTTADAFFADPGMLPPGYVGQYGPTGLRPSVQADVKYTTAMGVKRVAYEGGPHLQSGLDLPNMTVINTVVNDPRMTTAMVDLHNEWTASGGDLLMYFSSAGDAQWGFTQSIFNLATYKLNAIDTLNTVDHVPVTFGTLIPASLAGTAADACPKLTFGCNGNSLIAKTGNGQPWASYSFRSNASATWTVTLTLANPAASSTVAVYVDGVQIDATKTASAGTITFNAGTVDAGLHGVIVRAVAGSFTLSSIAVN